MAEETMSDPKTKQPGPPTKKPKGTTIPKGTTGEELARQISKDLAKAGTGKGLEADVIGSIVGKSISKVIVKKNRVGKSSRGIVRYKPDKGTQPASDRPLMSAVGSHRILHQDNRSIRSKEREEQDSDRGLNGQGY